MRIFSRGETPSFLFLGIIAVLVVVTNACLKEEGKFLCKSGECLDGIKVCDKHPDCKDESDEFPGCETSCRNTTCSQGCLPDPTQTAPGSGNCYCYKGYTPSSRDKYKCEDVDECAKFGACSQLCINFPGSYRCSCAPGFREKNNSSCELIDNTPTLIFATLSSVRVQPMSGDHESYHALVERSGSPVSVTYDARNNWVYWTDVLERDETIWRSKLDGTDQEKVVTTGLTLPEGIAYDWIANNIYFTDSNRSHIVVCTPNGGNCSVVIEDLSKPRDLAVHPNMGHLYWTDWGTFPSIMKAGMDGSVPVAIIHDDLKWPNGITIDYGNSRIYWTDAGTDKIETATLTGEDRLVIHSVGIKHPFGIDVLGDDVYWSDWNLHELQKSNKFDGSDHQVLVKEKFEQLNGLSIFHKANQPSTRKNHCKDAKCSHICTLTPNSYRCMCPTGMYFDKNNKRTCLVDRSWPNFVVAFNNTVKISPIDAIGGNTFKEYVIPGLSTIVAITTIPLNTTVFISDLDTKKIYSYDTNNLNLTTIVNGVGFAKGLDYDEVGNNLYWVDSARKTVEVMSLTTKARAVIFKEIDRPVDIVVAPDIRMLFLAQMTERGGKIVRMNMNGFNRRVLFRRSRTEPISLTYNIEMKRLYWTDSISETIESIGIDGTEGYLAVARAGYPFGVASYKSSIYWTDRHTQSLMGKHLITFVNDRAIFLGDYDSMKKGEAIHYTGSMMAKVTILNNEVGYKPSLLTEHDCSPHKSQCSHICLLSAEEMEGTCICPDNFKLDKDDRSCVALTDGDVPSPVICTGGRCRTQLTTKKPSKSSKSKASKDDSGKSGSSEEKGKKDKGKKDSKEKEKTEKGNISGESTTIVSSSSSEFPEYSISDDFSWWNDDEEPDTKKKSKSKNKKGSNSDRESRREPKLDYDDYVGSLSSNAKMLPDGRIVIDGEPVIQQESDVEKDVITEGTHPLAIALGIIILLVLVAVIVAIVLHRRNVHPKVLVRPYVQHWVKYVNQPVQRFFENRGDHMDSGKRHIYDEVYHSPTTAEHSYSRAYENIDDDSSVNVYEDPGDSHRITYSQSDKLIQ